MNRRASRRGGGFSLFEMIVAAVVLTVGLVLVMQSISSSLASGAGAERRLAAHRLAADRLARAAAGAATETQGRTRHGPIMYRWRIEESDGPAGLRALTCTVRWTRRGVEKHLTVRRRGGFPSAARP